MSKPKKTKKIANAANLTRFRCQVTDAKKSLNIQVTEADAKDAVCRDHQRCVIARAILRRSKAKWVDVGASIVLIGKANGTASRYMLDPVARAQVRFFDETGAFAPCRVRLDSPPTTIKLGFRRGPKSRSGSRRRAAATRRVPTR